MYILDGGDGMYNYKSVPFTKLERENAEVFLNLTW